MNYSNWNNIRLLRDFLFNLLNWSVFWLWFRFSLRIWNFINLLRLIGNLVFYLIDKLSNSLITCKILNFSLVKRSIIC